MPYIMKINEIFYSLQGEGARQGTPNIFVRFSGCNLSCSYCDTEHTGGRKMTTTDIAMVLKMYPCKNIVWTGGEPCLQLSEEVVAYFKALGYYQAIETNGTKAIPKGIDYISISPKDFNIFYVPYSKIDEIRVVVDLGTLIPEIKNMPKADNYFLSPVFSGGDYSPILLNQVIAYIKEHPQWRLSMQIHKILKFP